jgi:hypothetical protein
MHHIGSQEELPVAGFEQLEEEQQDVAAKEVQAPEDVEELPACLDHRPSTFERGKPQSISLLRFAN